MTKFTYLSVGNVGRAFLGAFLEGNFTPGATYISTNTNNATAANAFEQTSIFDAVSTVCGAGSMKRSRVRLSVCPIDRQQQRRAAGLLLSAPRAGYVDRLLHGAPAGCSRHDVLQVPALSSKCGQRHVDSRCRRLNTDLFNVTPLTQCCNLKQVSDEPARHTVSQSRLECCTQAHVQYG